MVIGLLVLMAKVGALIVVVLFLVFFDLLLGLILF